LLSNHSVALLSPTYQIQSAKLRLQGLADCRLRASNGYQYERLSYREPPQQSIGLETPLENVRTCHNEQQALENVAISLC